MEWMRLELLGYGSYGVVHKTMLVIEPLESCVAFKSCFCEYSSSLQMEERILSNFRDCKEVIQCIGSFIDDAEYGVPVYNLMLEYAPGGSLLNLISSHGGIIPEFNVKKYATMLLKGLSCIHNKGYIHCDFKPENILVSYTQDGSIQLKIADFGLAMELDDLVLVENSSGFYGGTPLYMPPECALHGVITPLTDIWSLGCVIFQMLTGNHVWDNDWDVEYLLDKFEANESPRVPENLSEEAKDFLKWCFQVDPSERWTADMLLRHPFIVGNDRQPTVAVPIEVFPLLLSA